MAPRTTAAARAQPLPLPVLLHAEDEHGMASSAGNEGEGEDRAQVEAREESGRGEQGTDGRAGVVHGAVEAEARVRDRPRA